MQEDPTHTEGLYQYSKIASVKSQMLLIDEHISREEHRNSIALLTQLLEISPWSKQFREMRADSYMKDDDLLAAVSDLRSVNKLSQDSTDGYYKLSIILYQLGHASDSLKEIRDCLKLDPEHKDCFPFYKKVKKIEKSLTDAQAYYDEKQFSECIKSAEKVLKFETEIPMILFSAKQLLCSCYVKDEQYTAAIGKCREALELHKDPSVLCDRADAYLETEMFDDGKLNVF